MIDQNVHGAAGAEEQVFSRPDEGATGEVKTAEVAQTAPAVEEGHRNGEHNGTEAHGEPTWHADAGRKGAQRIHQLIQQGRQYEQEHGLKRGRQRLRQLIEEGKLY